MKLFGAKFFFFAFAAVAALLAAYSLRENDPFYHGKRLNEHVLAIGPSSIGPSKDFYPSIGVGSTEGEEWDAIRATGTNALPMFVRMAGTRNTMVRVRLNQLLYQFPRLQKVLGKPRADAWENQRAALAAFYVLGQRAIPAVPGIIPLLKHPDTSLTASTALSFIQPEREQDILSLTNVLQISSFNQRGEPTDFLHLNAILALSKFGSKAAAAEPFLVNRLTVTNDQTAAAAGLALFRIGAPADKVVPLIITNLMTPVSTGPLSRNYAVKKGSATVPVAVIGVPPMTSVAAGTFTEEGVCRSARRSAGRRPVRARRARSPRCDCIVTA